MRDDKWKDTAAMIRQKFTVLSEGKEELEGIPNGTAEFIEFESPQGRMKIVRKVTPAVLDKKTMYSKTSGRASQVEYTYSQDEFVDRLSAYRWDDAKEDWEEVKAPIN